jgi:uncharacterized membrane protein
MTEEPQSNDPQPTEPEKTSLGLAQNVEGALTYVLGWATGIAFLLLEKENRFIRFHAMQSIAVFAPLTILSWILTGFLGFLLMAASLVLWVVLVVKAAQGEQYKLPIIGDLVEKRLNQ